MSSIDPIHVAFPRRPSQNRLIKTSRESIDSSSSSSSCETPSPRKLSLTDSESCNSPLIIHSDDSLASHNSPVSSSNSCEAWSRRSQGPVLSLFMKAPTLETTPDSSPDKMSFSRSPRRSPHPEVLFPQYSLVPDKDPFLLNSNTSDSYNITSLSSLRKQKMDRLRKKLGGEVPFNLVFPSSDSDSERSITPTLPSSINEYNALLPPPPPSPPMWRPRKNSGRLSSARDSIVGCASVHHAKRFVSKPTLTSAPKSEFSEPKRLSFIIESPNEHGGGCAQDFGQPLELDQGAEFRSEWSVSEVKLLSTRRGYEGWRPNPPPKVSQSPSTVAYSPPPLPSKSIPSNTQPKKKPPSYRKPVPRLVE